LYKQPDSPRGRRLADTVVTVAEDGVVGWDHNEPFATLVRAHGGLEPFFDRRIGASRQATRASPTTNTEVARQTIVSRTRERHASLKENRHSGGNG
jgi:hypothetical protein